MPYRLETASDYVRLVFDAVLILLGVCLLLGIFDLSVQNPWLPWILAITGVFLVSIPGVRLAGGVVTLVGVYLILRYLDFVSVPVLRYALGGLLILLGVVNLVRGAGGGGPPTNKTSTEQ